MIQVFIITHKRPEWCLFVLKQLAKDRHKKRVTIFHDKCDSDYSEVIEFCNTNKWEYFKTKGFGKWRFWEMLNIGYNYFRIKEYKYFLQIPDDIVLVKNFFSRIKSLHETETDLINPLTLNYHINRFKDKEQTENIIYSNWSDNCFFTTKKVMDQMYLTIPRNAIVRNERCGTGTAAVFSQIYHETFNKDVKQTKYALVYHRGGYGKTVMHKKSQGFYKVLVNREKYKYGSLLTDSDWQYIDNLNIEKMTIADLVKNKTVAFVGLAPSIKGKGLGKEIDSHDIVFRTNMYNVPKHLHADYGKKTTVISMLKQYLHLIPEYIKQGLKYIVTFEELKDYDAKANYRVADEDYRRAVATQMNEKIDTKLIWPTSGLLAYFLCKGCESFKYYGITGYQNENGQIQNHNGNNNYIKEYTDFWGERKEELMSRNMVEDKYHNFKAHNEYMRYLIKNNLIEIDKYSHEYFRSSRSKRQKHTV